MFTVSYASLASLLVLLVYLLAIITAAKAVMHARTSQAATAWTIALLSFPYISLPLFWLFGRRKFHGYADTLGKAYAELETYVQEAYSSVMQYEIRDDNLQPLQKTMKRLTHIGFTRANAIDLLIDGEQTYQQMLAAIDNAQDYILFQFFIIRDDVTGKRFQQALMERAKAGVKVYFLYDEIGCYKLPEPFISQLVDAGVMVSSFHSTKGRGNRLQVNFRNHRKVIIADGKVALIGGLNIGDEYLGRKPAIGFWRDTHLKLQGPAVQDIQLVFLRDWYWAKREVPDVSWRVFASDRQQTTAIVPTGPDRRLETGALFMLAMIHQARQRLWIASPYFVPDDGIIRALQLAVLRGVDVRIMLPHKADHRMVYFCSFAYYNDMKVAGVKLYRYKKGFMHQKVILVDNRYAGVGTVNLDNRSLYLNFEITAVVAENEFIEQVENMLNEDFSACYEVDLTQFNQRSYLSRLMIKLVRLCAPVL